MSTSGRARNTGEQLTHFMRKTVNYGDLGISAGVKMGRLPQGAFVIGTSVEIVTAFNAGSTNVLTVGGGTNFNEFIASGDVTAGSTGLTRINTKGGRALAASADADVYVKYAQTGTAASTGQAVIVVEYAPNNDG